MTRVVGLDIGSSAIRAAELKDAERARPTLVRYLEQPLTPGIVERDEVRDRPALAAAIRELWSRARFGTKDVVLGVADHRIPARELSVRVQSLDLVREQLPMLVQNLNLLPVPVSEALLDFAPFEIVEDEEQGPMYRGLLVAAIRESVLTAVETVESAGLHVAGVDIVPFALARLFLGGPRRAGTTALVDIGESTTHIVVAQDGTPEFIRAVALGERDLVAAVDELRAAMGLGPLQGPSRPEEFVPAASELLVAIRDTVGFFRGARPDAEVDRLFVSGGTARFPGIREAIGEFVQVPVAPAAFDDRLVLSRQVANIAWDTAPGSSVPVGLALGSHS